MDKTSQISGFYELTTRERLEVVKDFAKLTDEEVELLHSAGSLKLELADQMIENVVGTFPVPLGIAVNFLINGRDYLIPMATEQPSIIASTSYAAKMARSKGGFFTSSTEPIMIGQVQAVNVPNPHGARMAILAAKEEILSKANEGHQRVAAKDLGVRVIQSSTGCMVVTELYVDCRDLMGANVVDDMAEAIAPTIKRITHGKVYLRIISNLATKRLARAWTVVAKEAVGGEDIVDGIVEACAFAAADPYRAATHNKGVMNAISAIALATCNDHRAVEAGAHAYAAMSGHYSPLTIWEKNKDGDLIGSIELPMAVGIIGGATKVHPVAKVALKILGVKTANELGEVMAAVGLAQNLAILRTLTTKNWERKIMHNLIIPLNIQVSRDDRLDSCSRSSV